MVRDGEPPVHRYCGSAGESAPGAAGDEQPINGHQRELGRQIQTAEDVDRAHDGGRRRALGACFSHIAAAPEAIPIPRPDFRSHEFSAVCAEPSEPAHA
jgi:hypothetical protein